MCNSPAITVSFTYFLEQHTETIYFIKIIKED